MKNFALIGAAGYIAPRHLKAIRETGNNLLCAADPHDSVGILDQFFPNADFFTEFERFDRHVDKLRRNQSSPDFVSICSPNYLHDAHIRWALRSGADAICEKPLVLNPWNVDILEQFERETGRRIWNILQLRLHASVIGYSLPTEGRPIVKLTYITPPADRGITIRGKAMSRNPEALPRTSESIFSIFLFHYSGPWIKVM